MKMLSFLCVVYSLVFAVISVRKSNSSGIGKFNIILLDESRAQYHLALIGSKIAVMTHMDPEHWTYSWNSLFLWTASRWYYNPQIQRIIYLNNGCIEANPMDNSLLFKNCSSSSQHQTFIYNQADKELLWITPTTKLQYPVYLEKDGGRTVKMVPYLPRKPLISKNPVSTLISEQYRRFDDQMQMNALNTSTLRLRAVMLYGLKFAMPHMSTSEYVKYLEIIESLNKPQFEYILYKDHYLIGDGYSVKLVTTEQMIGMNYKYYGLWHVNENNHLIHFLSGKCLHAMQNHRSRNVVLLENMLSRYFWPGKVLSGLNDTFYDLRLRSYTNETHHLCVHWNQDQMYVHQKEQMMKIESTINVDDSDLLLAFVNNSAHDQFIQMAKFRNR